MAGSLSCGRSRTGARNRPQDKILRRRGRKPAGRIASPAPFTVAALACALAQGSALIWDARAKSASVSPPAECVDKVSVTLFQEIAMSG